MGDVFYRIAFVPVAHALMFRQEKGFNSSISPVGHLLTIWGIAMSVLKRRVCLLEFWSIDSESCWGHCALPSHL